MKPSLKCARELRTCGMISLSATLNEMGLANFIAEQTGCDELAEINAELLAACKLARPAIFRDRRNEKFLAAKALDAAIANAKKETT